MIRFVEGVGVMGGLNWMPGGQSGSGGGLFGAMLGDASGSSRGASNFGETTQALERGARERERKGSGIEASGGGVPPLEPGDRRAGRGERMVGDPGATKREAAHADPATSGDRNAPARDASESVSRSESRSPRSGESSSREGGGSDHSRGGGGGGDATIRTMADGQAMAAHEAAGAASPAGASAVGASSIRLIAQPGGELGLSMGNAGGRGMSVSSSRQGVVAPGNTPDAEAVVRAASRGVNSALAQRGGTITIRLIPETLGALRVQVEVDAGRVSVRVEASNPQAAEMLHANAASLRQSLESRGMQVERIQVMVQNPDAARLSPTQDGRGGEGAQGDQGGTGDRDGRQRGMDGQSGREEDSRDGLPRDDRSPMERFGERLRLILDGVS